MYLSLELPPGHALELEEPAVVSEVFEGVVASVLSIVVDGHGPLRDGHEQRAVLGLGQD